MSTIERRTTSHHIRVQSRSTGQQPLITGYAAVFYDPNDPGTEYRLYDDTVERIMPTAFDRAIKEDDVRGLFNHDDNLVLGRVKSGTLRLSVDRKGLRFEIDPPDTQSARELIESIKRGDVSGCSFSFLPDVSAWRNDNGVYVVERRSVTLFDVGPVAYPAYPSTEAAVRGSHVSQPPGQQNARAAVWARARAVEVEMGLRS